MSATKKAAPGYGYDLKRNIEDIVALSPNGITYDEITDRILLKDSKTTHTPDERETIRKRIYNACRTLAGQQRITLTVIQVTKKITYTSITPKKH